MDPGELQELAELAKLRLDPERAARLQEQVTRLLAWFDMLQSVNTEGIAPSPYPMPIPHRLRPDEPEPTPEQEEVLQNAPKSRSHAFLVPRVVEG